MVEDVFSEWFGARKPAEAEQDAPPPAADGHGQASSASINELTEAADEPAQQPECAAVNDWDEPSEPAEPVRLALALKMAAAELHILPLLPGDKVPFGKFEGWTKADAPEDIKPSRDPEQIRRWFYLYPDMNYACVPLADFVIVDVDVRKGGNETIAALPFKLPEDTFVVSTPSGGRHLYYRATAEIRGGTDKLGKGGDVQAGHRYVVGPGSFFADPGGKKGYTGDYRVINDTAFLPSPEGLVLVCGTASARERDAAPVAEQDRPEDIERAVRFLADAAPAVEGKGGDVHTFRVACELRDLGLTEGTALDMMAGEWNARCLPPWLPEELAAKVANAFSYGQNRPAAKSTAAMADGFADAVTLDSTPAPAPALPLFRMQSLRERRANLETPQGIEWVYGSLFARKLLTVTVAAGGVGKSTLAIAEKLAIATGHPLLGVEVHRKSRVAYYNLEDGIDTADRAIKAALQHYGLSLDDPDVLDSIMVMSGRDAPVKIATADRGATKIIEPLIEAMVAWLRACRVKVLTIDPFVDTHAVPESDNSAINEVAKAWGRVAERADCAVHLVHHVRKLNGKRVEAEDARGAVALIAAARVTRTLAHVTEPNDMAALGIGDADARNYFLSEDGGKRNVGQASGKLFFRRANVPIAVQREGGAGYENVPVAVKAAITAAHATVELTPAQIEAIAVEIERRPTWRAENGNIDNRITWPIMKALGIDPLQHDSEDRADAVLKTLARRKIVKRLPLATPYSASLSRSGKKCPCYALAPREQWDGAADWSDAKTIEAKETDDEDA